MTYSALGIAGFWLTLALARVYYNHTSHDVLPAPTEAQSQATLEAQTKTRLLRDKIEGVIVGAALGDALGRITEFIETTDAITKRYGPKGVVSFKNFTPGDWVMHPYSRECIAAYTDDTVMSLIVLEEALYNANAQTLIGAITQRFRDLFGKEAFTIDPLYQMRAHGIQNRTACTRLSAKTTLETVPPYDHTVDALVAQEGGCGSVMRAWPLGIVFYTDLKKVAFFADLQSRITHRHPMARAASAALAVGVASLLQGSTPDGAVENMIKAAQKFDEAEKLYKPAAHALFEASSIAEDKMLTSTMIAYAAERARAGAEPRDILGTHNNKTLHRSSEGFLLGWAADEAVAAAVYVFLRHSDDLASALQESVNTPGDSDSIATLAAALVGAYSGWGSFKKTGFDYSSLENRVGLEEFVELVTSHLTS